jgi:hypothetical protein
MSTLLNNLIPAAVVAAEEGVSDQTKRLHRKRGTRRVVDGVLTGVDSMGFPWCKLGNSVWYFADGRRKRLEYLSRQASR